MTPPRRTVTASLLAPSIAVVLALGAAACGVTHPATAAGTTSATETTLVLPGAGHPTVTIGDKNFTEQFVLGELYGQALRAQGFSVLSNRNIGPIEVTIRALQNGTLSLYPEYLGTWNTMVAGYLRTFPSRSGAYRAAQRYAVAHGLELLDLTPFSDTDAIGVTSAYAAANGLRTIGDLTRVAPALTLGAPPQFAQLPADLPALEQAYGFLPSAFKALEVGGQFQALDAGSVQAADVSSTAGQLTLGKYDLLRDTRNVFGWGNVIPVVPAKVLTAEGPAFAATINQVSALLTLTVMRKLNADVDVQHQDPATVAKRFLQAQGLVVLTTGR
ncbi:MAG: glycine betaine ABC transporter substrate-binding protein [Solirubrobacteraceae bacterium]